MPRGNSGRRGHRRRVSRKAKPRRRYSLMEGVPGERRAALLTEAVGSTPSTSHSPSGEFRAGGRVTGNLRGYVFSSSHGRQRRGGVRRKASHLGGRKRPGSAWSAWSKLAHAVKCASLEVRIARLRQRWFGVGGPSQETGGRRSHDRGCGETRVPAGSRESSDAWMLELEVGCTSRTRASCLFAAKRVSRPRKRRDSILQGRREVAGEGG